MKSSTEIVGTIIAEFIDNARTGSSESRYLIPQANPRKKDLATKRDRRAKPRRSNSLKTRRRRGGT